MEDVISLEEFELLEGTLKRTRYNWDEALQYIEDKKVVTAKEIQQITGASQARVRSWLLKQVENGKLVRGLLKGRIVYVLKEFYENFKKGQ